MWHFVCVNYFFGWAFVCKPSRGVRVCAMRHNDCRDLLISANSRQKNRTRLSMSFSSTAVPFSSFHGSSGSLRCKSEWKNRIWSCYAATRHGHHKPCLSRVQRLSTVCLFVALCNFRIWPSAAVRSLNRYCKLRAAIQALGPLFRYANPPMA